MFLKTSGGAVVRLPPLVVCLAAHPFCMEYRTMAVLLVRPQPVEQPEWGRRSHGPPETTLLRFLLVLWINFQLKDVSDWPSRANFLAALQIAAIVSSMNFSCYYVNAGFYNAFCQSKWLPCGGHKDMSYFNDDNTRPWSEGAAISCWNCRCCSTNRRVFVWRMKPTCFWVLNGTFAIYRTKPNWD